MSGKRFIVLALVVLTVAALAAPAAAGGPRNFRAHLDGDGAGVETLAQGQATFRFKVDGSLTFRLTIGNIQNVTMAHIHVAAVPGGNGPPVLWLYPDGPPPTLIPGRFSGVLGANTVGEGALTGAAGVATFEDLITAIEEGRAYVNVHTAQNGGGEIRGDIF